MSMNDDERNKHIEALRAFLTNLFASGRVRFVPPQCVASANTPFGVMRRFMWDPCPQCKALLMRHYNN